MQVRMLVTVVGRDVAAAERGAVEPADSVSTDRPLRADAVRNRELLLTAAAAAFSAHGADVPLEDIARNAGVGIGTLYRHFPTRDSLVEAVYRHEVDVLCESADQLLETLPPDQALEEWMQLFVRHVATKRGMLSVLKPMLSSNPTFFAETKGRATAAAPSSSTRVSPPAPSAPTSGETTCCAPSAASACRPTRSAPRPPIAWWACSSMASATVQRHPPRREHPPRFQRPQCPHDPTRIRRSWAAYTDRPSPETCWLSTVWQP